MTDLAGQGTGPAAACDTQAGRPACGAAWKA